MKEIHPLTALIPTRADRDELVMQIASEGLREPVVLYEGKIIEGRVRYQAALEVSPVTDLGRGRSGKQEPLTRDWVLFAKRGETPLDWMVRRHIATHELEELDLIRLAATVLPSYRKMRGSTHRSVYNALGGQLSWNKIRSIDWLAEADALTPVLRGEKSLTEAARAAGYLADTRGIRLPKNYGKGDKFDEAIQPIKRYLAGWKRRGYEFRHVNPKEAQRRLLLIDSVVEELEAARFDLKKRSKEATLSAPPERKKQ